jgi:hypothetical protein
MPFPPKGYMEKMPFKSLPPKGESKKSMKKKKKRSKRRQETVSSPKHVAPIIDYDNSDWDDIPMPVIYVSDHDWEKHSTFDIENPFGTNSKVNKCCTISTIHVPSYDDMFDEYALQNSCSLAYDDIKPLVYDGYDDEFNILVHLLLRRKLVMITICLLFLMIMVMSIIILLNLLLLRLFMWGLLILLCMWLMIGMLYVIVILLVLFMMLLKVTMREGNMV